MASTGSRKPEKALTAAEVRNAGPGKHFDGHGLFLRVQSNGAKQWVQRIVIRGKRCELGLGSPPLVSLAAARETALDNRRLARAGGDPLNEKREERAVPTFNEATDQFLAAKLSEFRNDKHKAQWRSTLDTYAAPIIGPKRVSEVKLADVLRVLEPIWRTKTETASRLRGRIEAVLSWTTVAGHRTGDNPARWKGNLDAMLPKPGKVAKADNHPALALADAACWYAALRLRDGMAARALEFLALTAARSGEVRGALWPEFDLDAGLWTIPAGRMKAGREHRVPMTAEAIALLRSLPRMTDAKGKDVPFVFFAPRGGMLSDMSLSAVMRRMQEAEAKRLDAADSAAGRKPPETSRGFVDPRSGRPAVPHGLRSTFRDWAAERTEFPRDIAEIALAHNVGSEVERAYRRGDMLERRRGMMAAWGRFLRGEDGAKVVRLDGTAA
jgi:integrase